MLLQVCHLQKAVLTLHGFRSSFTNGTLQRGEQGTAAQGTRDRGPWVGASLVGFAAKAGRATSLRIIPARSSLHPSQAPIALLSDSYIA